MKRLLLKRRLTLSWRGRDEYSRARRSCILVAGAVVGVSSVGGCGERRKRKVERLRELSC